MVPADGVVVVIGVVMVVIAGGVLMAGMISVGEGSLTMVSDVSQIKWVWHRFDTAGEPSQGVKRPDEAIERNASV